MAFGISRSEARFLCMMMLTKGEEKKKAKQKYIESSKPQ